jgi:hypothetical protein
VWPGWYICCVPTLWVGTSLSTAIPDHEPCSLVLCYNLNFSLCPHRALHVGDCFTVVRFLL